MEKANTTNLMQHAPRIFRHFIKFINAADASVT